MGSLFSAYPGAILLTPPQQYNVLQSKAKGEWNNIQKKNQLYK